jgi:hypothetical protein
MMSVLSLLWLFACRPSPEDDAGATTKAPPESVAPESTPEDTSEEPTTSAVLGCDLPSIPTPSAPSGPDASTMLYTTFVGESWMWMGHDVAVVAGPQGASTLVVGAPGVDPCVSVYEICQPRSRIWLFDAPLLPGSLDPSSARAWLWGTDPLVDLYSSEDGSVLTVGDLTGDGLEDFVSGPRASGYASHYVVAAPFPVGEQQLGEVAQAKFERGSSISSQTGIASIGDWNADGVGDISVGANSTGQLWNAAEVFLGPVSGTTPLGNTNPQGNGAAAWFDVGALNAIDFQTGSRSVLVPDVTGDGASEFLVSGDGWELVDFQGLDPGVAGGFALFAGNVAGAHDHTEALALFHAPCDPSPAAPVVVGDVTGDGKADVAVHGYAAMVDGSSRGALWILSRLDEAGGLMTLTQVSQAIVGGHEQELLTDEVGLDLNGDGAQDLAVLTELHLYVFLGPLQGAYDLNEADLVLRETGAAYGHGALAAGDLDGDGVPELVVGDPLRGVDQHGEVRIYSGQRMREALP